MIDQAEFWTNAAATYRGRPISNMDAYEQTLERTAEYLRPDARVLELGCGTGGTAERLGARVGSYLASDFSTGMIAQARARDVPENVTFQVADVFDLTFEPGGFDAIIAYNLFHLVDDRAAQFERVRALLAPGGVFITKAVCLAERNLGFQFNLLRAAIPVMQWLGKAPAVQYLTMRQLEDEITAGGFQIVETGNYPAKPPNHFVVAKPA